MAWVEYPLPEAPLEAEAVLHVRVALQRRLRTSTASAADLALLFGLDAAETAAVSPLVEKRPRNLFEAVADAVARSRGLEILDLPSDAAHVCRWTAWLAERKREEPAFEKIVAHDLASLLSLSKARDLAVTQAPPGIGMEPEPIPILIIGETGTGKELVARAIHEIWKRETKATGSFVAVHVGGMTTALINDELFGHVKGAYTDASDGRKGRVEEANGGTLLIDEVGDLPHDAQVRLLRVTQEQQLSRLGEERLRDVRVRFVSATWHPLEAQVEAGTFRRDLFHRLRAGQLYLPPLRERSFFGTALDELVRGLGHTIEPPLSREARDALAMQRWEGNLRELVSVLREAISNAAGQVIRLADMPSRIQQQYLAAPLAFRLPGKLEEPLGTTPPTPEVIERRMAGAALRVGSLPLPPPLPVLVALRDFLRSIPDLDDTHKRTARAFETQIRLVQASGHAQQAAQIWEYVSEVAANTDVKRHAQGAARDARADADARAAEVEAARVGLEVADASWLRLAKELAALPIFAGTPVMELLPGVLALIRGGYSIAPELMPEIRAILTTRGLGGIRDEIKRLASETHWSAPTGKPNAWSKDDWRSIMARFGSKTEAARGLEINVTTIDRNLKKLKMRWRS